MGRLRETSATDKRLVTMQGDVSADIEELWIERDSTSSRGPRSMIFSRNIFMMNQNLVGPHEHSAPIFQLVRNAG